MAEDDQVDPRLLVDRNGDRIAELEAQVEELRSMVDSMSPARSDAPDLSLYDKNIAALAARATAIENFIQNMEGQDGITVKGNKIFLDRRMSDIEVPNYGITMDLTVYDTDETTVLYTGSQRLFITIDDAGTQKEMFYVKTEFCIDSSTLYSFVLRSLVAA